MLRIERTIMSSEEAYVSGRYIELERASEE